MKNIRYLFFLVLIFYYACSDYYPKPYGYFRIELKEPVYKLFVDSAGCFTSKIPEMADIETVTDTFKGDWFNIVYPSLDAKIYCSYLLIQDRDDLMKISEDSRKFVYKHTLKADAITEEIYSIPGNGVYSIIYDIEGNVASPVQFVITDSTHYFFRGALYFNTVPNQDSIAPVVAYVRKDIQELILNFHWKKEKNQ